MRYFYFSSSIIFLVGLIIRSKNKSSFPSLDNKPAQLSKICITLAPLSIWFLICIFKNFSIINKTLLINPVYPLVHNNLGNALKDQGKPDQAIEAYTKALSIQPNNANAYYNMGIALREQGKLDEAIEAYKKALSINPDYADAYYNI